MSETATTMEFDGGMLSLEQAAFMIRKSIDIEEGDFGDESLERQTCAVISVIKPNNFSLGGHDYTFERRVVTRSNEPHRILLRDDRSKKQDHDFVVVTPHCCGVPWEGYQDYDTKEYKNGEPIDLTIFLTDLLRECDEDKSQ